MERGELLEQGIAVHRVREVYGDEHSNKDKWFVSVLANSPLAATVADIPLTDNESEAWEVAAQHYRTGKEVVKAVHHTVKPGAYQGVANAEIVRRVVSMKPDVVTIADFDTLDLQEIFEGFRAAGLNVNIAANSKTHL